MKKIFILTGEASGDKLASKVISKLKKDNLNIDYLSVGGETRLNQTLIVGGARTLASTKCVNGASTLATTLSLSQKKKFGRPRVGPAVLGVLPSQNSS